MRTDRKDERRYAAGTPHSLQPHHPRHHATRPDVGDPLIGPSALDAAAAGTVFLNPHFNAPKLEFFESQHPFLEAASHDHACAVDLDAAHTVLACARRALAADVPPFVPPEMARDAYLARLKAIVQPALG